MGQTFEPDVYRDWAAGVITSLASTEIPINASPHGLNSALVSFGVGKALVGVRRGATLVNLVTILDGSNNPVEIRSLAPFYYVGSATYYRLLTTSDGQLRTLNNDGTTTSVTSTFLTNNANPPIWTVLNDSAFCANGVDMKKVIVKAATLTPQAIGIVRPVLGGFAASAGAAGTPNGSYEVVVTYSNSTTGHESSRSDVITVTLTNQAMNLTAVPTSPDTQVDTRYIYVRNTATQIGYYRIATISDNTTTTQTNLNWVDANLTILSPDSVQNNPPLSTDPFNGVIAHAQRLIGWSGTNLYYSRFGKPEAFDPEAVEPISPKDGQSIVGCHRVNDSTLLVFKDRSLYGIYGADPATWEVRLLDPASGLLSPRAVETIEGVTYWWSPLGPMAWNHYTPPQQIGYAKLAPDIVPTALNLTQMKRSIVVADPPRQRVQFIFATSASATANDSMLPYSYRLGAFESNLWQAFDVASAARMNDPNGRELLYLGGYYGKIYTWWTADTDGARVADVNGVAFTLDTTVATGPSTTVFTTQAADNLDAANLVGLYCYLFDDVNVTYQRSRISAADNTLKQITVATAFAATPIPGQRVVIGGPMFEWDTKFQDNQEPFLMKRFFQVFGQGTCSSGATTANVDVFINGLAVTAQRTFPFVISAGGAVFDVAQFDIDVFAADSVSRLKARVAKIGFNYRLRVRHTIPNRPFILVILGMRSHSQNYRSQ